MSAQSGNRIYETWLHHSPESKTNLFIFIISSCVGRYTKNKNTIRIPTVLCGIMYSKYQIYQSTMAPL